MSFSRLAGLADEEGELGSKVVVLKSLGGDPRAPFFALLTRGFPRLVTVSRERLVLDADEQSGLPEVVSAKVTLNEDEAWIPDLAKIEAAVAEALHVTA